MFARWLSFTLVVCATCPAGVFGQQTSQAASTQVAAAVPEFPVILQRGVVAGKTPGGTKIQAKLAIATLVNGTVIPKNAILSGEVVESVAKTRNQPSRLSLRMDSAQWKDGKATLDVYLTMWYYPTVNEFGQDLQYGPAQPANRTWDGQGQYPDPNSKVYRPFPGSGAGKDSTVPDTPTSVTSNRQVAMKDIALEPFGDKGIRLVSKRTNIKLDKYTTYVFAAGQLIPAK